MNLLGFLISIMLGAPLETDYDDSKTMVNGLYISKTYLNQITRKSNTEYQDLVFYIYKDSIVDTFNYSHLDSFVYGVVYKKVNEKTAWQIFNKFHKMIEAEGNYIYLTHISFDSTKSVCYDLAIIKAEDQFEAVKIVGTNGLNYDISNEKVIEKLKIWHKEAKLIITVIDYNRVEAYMKRKPKNLENFTSEIIEFCPAIIGTGYSNQSEMISAYKEKEYFWIWWD